MSSDSAIAPALGEQTNWRQLAAQGNLADAILEHVRDYPGTSFPELLRHLSEYTPVAGNFALTTKNDPNFVFWTGMSESLVTALQDLLTTQRLFVHPTTPLTYFIDGGMLRLPVIKRPPKQPYRTPHWCPVTLRLTPVQAQKAGARRRKGPRS